MIKSSKPKPFHLLLLPALMLPMYGASAAPCSTPPIQVDDAIASLHAKGKAMRNQDLQELRLLVGKDHVTGVGVLRVDVDADGHVTAVTPLSGPKELNAIFGDEERRVAYLPFQQNGRPECVWFVARYELRLEPHPDGKAESRFTPAFERCAQQSAAGAAAAALASCEEAAQAAELLHAAPSMRRKQAAFTYYATALMQNGRARDALPFAEKAVATADLGFDDVDGKAAAYGVRGQARQLTGDVAGAEQDLAKAEMLDRAALELGHFAPDRRAFTTRALKSMLEFHASILVDLGRTQEADKLRDEAKTL